MAAVLTIGEISCIPSKKLGVIFDSRESELLYRIECSYLKDYFNFYSSWESFKKDQAVCKDLVLTVGEISNSDSNGCIPLILPIIKDRYFSILKRKTEEAGVKITPILANNVCSTLEDIKEAFLMPALINLTLDELKVLGDSDYIFTYRGISKNNLLDSAKMLQSIVESSLQELLDHQLNNLELKTLLIHVLGKEDLNIEDVCKVFSFTLDLLNTLIKVNRASIEGHFGVSAKNTEENRIILFLGLRKT